MIALEQWQRDLQAHILRGDDSIVPAIAVRGILAAPERLAIYHHAYRARLADVLRDGYGHTATWLGEAFDGLAAAYVESHGSTHASLRSYGRDFPGWLACAAPELEAAERKTAAELASIDRALRDAFDCADGPVARLADLAAVDPAAWDCAIIELSPCERLRVRRDTLALWRSIDEGEALTPPAEASPVHILVWRRGQQPHFRSIDALEWAALDELLGGRTFGELCGRLAEAHPDSDVAAAMGGLLRRWVEDELVASVR